MKGNFKKNWIMCLLIVFALVITCISVSSAVENTGEGKPKGVDIYLGDVPYGSSLGQSVKSGEKQVGDFNVILDDDKPGKADPTWFVTLGVTSTSTPTPTPTMTATPTATVVIPVDIGGVGAQLCAGDNSSDVIIDFAFSDAGYENTFKLFSPNSVALGYSQGTIPNRVGTPFGTTWNLGKFTAGQELIFADTANGKTYQTGPASRNPDKIAHAAITLKNTTGTYHKYLVTFEDFWNGGDKDYNDVEFYVSGNVSTQCTTGGSSGGGDSGGGAVIPIYVVGSVCKCKSPKYNDGNKATCVAQFTYLNSAGSPYTIPVHESSLPWNEFTGSGMVEQYRCQPTTFYVNSSQNSPFWTNRFWNNIKWKLGNEQSVLVKCDRDTPSCADSDAVCTECKSNDGKR